MIEQLTNKQLIRKNLRYATYKAVLKEEIVFVKEGVGNKTTNTLWREAMGLQNMQELDLTESHYKIPRVISVSENTLITSWADGLTMTDTISDSTIDNIISSLVEIYTFIDSKSQNLIGTTRWNQPSQSNFVTKYQSRLEELQASRFVDKDKVFQVLDYAKNIITSIETRFTHGDLQPGNILVEDNNLPTIIDCESCSWLWPRHYNMINFVFNYTIKTRQKYNRNMSHGLKNYFSLLHIAPEEIIEQINISAIMRCIGIIVEHLGGHADQSHDDIPRAILDVVDNSLDNILSDKLFYDSWL